ncbi:MAG: methyltransferase domain-containing protein [Rickettsiales bacterium]|nr:MAG: methyltransferase domain-containing protein [Rickettsiales bacterium]
MIDIKDINNTHIDNTAKRYNELQYESYPYHQSSPEKIATLGVLFGMNPAKIETARVLELGCAAGGNIIPHAINYPKGKYVGIDLSEKQIDEGQDTIKKLGLKNIELKCTSITEVNDSYGKFDYIICHGVFSWVPDFVQDKILEICNKNLSENGIAYISYNTLPGWNMVRTVRDMMLYHSQGFNNIQDKIIQSRALLAFVKESTEGMDNAYAKMLAQEADLLSKQRDSYIAHEHLEDNNKQFYFSDFMKKATEHNLQYLSDTALTSMYLGNMKPSVVEKLKEVNDIIKTEQYLDFINNRRFRSTLLCHNNIPLNRALNNESIKKFSMSLDITPEKPFSEKNINHNDTVKFFFKNDPEQHISSTSPYLKGILYVLSENKGYPIKVTTLIEKVSKLFNNDKKQEIETELIANAMTLVIKGYIDISLNEKDKNKINLDKPCISNLALHQVNDTNNNWITGINHTAVGINIFDKFALKYMDGNNTQKDILEHLVKEVKNKTLTVSKDNVQIEDPEIIMDEFKAYLKESITRLASQGVFQ